MEVLGSDEQQEVVRHVHTTALASLACVSRRFRDDRFLTDRLARLDDDLHALLNVFYTQQDECDASNNLASRPMENRKAQLLHSHTVYVRTGWWWRCAPPVFDDALGRLLPGRLHPNGPLEVAERLVFTSAVWPEATHCAFLDVVAIGALPQLTALCFDRSKIGDIGLVTLANACAKGALAQVVDLRLGQNHISDNGLVALAKAITPDKHGKGALAQVTTLRLNNNRIGDEGLVALAGACVKGALAQVTELDLTGNRIGDEGLVALADACVKGALAQVTELNLKRNGFGDIGLAALADAVDGGALASLQLTRVNNEHHPALQAACRARGI